MPTKVTMVCVDGINMRGLCAGIGFNKGDAIAFFDGELRAAPPRGSQVEVPLTHCVRVRGHDLLCCGYKLCLNYDLYDVERRIFLRRDPERHRDLELAHMANSSIHDPKSTNATIKWVPDARLSKELKKIMPPRAYLQATRRIQPGEEIRHKYHLRMT